MIVRGSQKLAFLERPKWILSLKLDASQRFLDIVQHLLKIGTDINFKDYTGETLLFKGLDNCTNDCNNNFIKLVLFS